MCRDTTCDGEDENARQYSPNMWGFWKGGLSTKGQYTGSRKRGSFRDDWYVNYEGMLLTGANAYGYYDWFAPEEGEEGYILAKHEGE